MEQAIMNGNVVNLVEADTIQEMEKEGTVDFIEEVFLGETEYKGEGVYKLYYSHSNQAFYAFFAKYMSWRSYEIYRAQMEAKADALAPSTFVDPEGQ